MTDGLFELKTPEDLFAKTQRDLRHFFEAPSGDHLFNLLCSLYHLREWIRSGQEQNSRAIVAHTEAAALSTRLRQDPEYQIICALCNNAKHFSNRSGIGSRSQTFIGARLGFLAAGDSLGRRHYSVDGKDLRGVILHVYSQYLKYFRHGPSQLQVPRSSELP